MSDDLKPLIGTAAERPLTRAEAETAFEALFEGEATPSQMGGFLMALRTRGETVDEYAAAAAVMRAKATKVAGGADAMDVVGAGGDQSAGKGLAVCVDDRAADATGRSQRTRRSVRPSRATAPAARGRA